MRFVFWNAAKKKVNGDIISLVRATGANVFALAEYADDPVDLLGQFALAGLDFRRIPVIGCRLITLFADFNDSLVSPFREADRYTIHEFRLPGKQPFLACFVHLPSKLHRSPEDQSYGASILRRDIEASEAAAGHTRTLILGDFNMNPFENGMVSVSALNSLPCLFTANATSRVHQGQQSFFFYNPTWSLMGDLDEVPGTYFHGSPDSLSHYWNTFDQLLLRPSLGQEFSKESLKAITMAGTTRFACAKGRPVRGDHLPITFEINVAEIA